jgi:hypothetical protein
MKIKKIRIDDDYSYDPVVFNPHLRLWYAVIIRAIRDYVERPADLKSGDYESAMRFLYSPLCAELIEEATGLPMLSHRRILNRIKANKKIGSPE